MHDALPFILPLMLAPGWFQAMYRIGKWAWGTRRR